MVLHPLAQGLGEGGELPSLLSLMVDFALPYFTSGVSGSLAGSYHDNEGWSPMTTESASKTSATATTASAAATTTISTHQFRRALKRVLLPPVRMYNVSTEKN